VVRRLLRHRLLGSDLNEELRRRFPGYVDPDFSLAAFEPFGSCDEVVRARRFKLIGLECHARYLVALSEVTRHGLRPTLPDELLAFDERSPDHKLKHPLVALGAFDWREVRRPRVLCLRTGSAGPELRLIYVDEGFDAGSRLVATPK
jgi:hypothetical protein